ncbi:uncharacterized protein KQ657_005035 [Scheffersomyces spartinae]|uniref:CCHC-type domain-containing protein n=1 Tax=Scheffersomyces spartinae TaxID=45513 RepID=A0A9P7V9M5_9ASCO|nr:uncharacterized protein KQ657_005035 [Scheffersomyces spartinae]KAG7193837.1 hypothetical protein KQ657_005035 [Scheffersomyces spartinae]
MTRIEDLERPCQHKLITEKYGFPTVSHLINFYDSLHKTENYALTCVEVKRIHECYSPAELAVIFLLLAQPTSIRHAFASRVQALPPTIVDGVPRRTPLTFDLFQSVCASEALREPKKSTTEMTLATFNNRRPFGIGNKRRFSSRKFICYNCGKPGHGISDCQQPLQKPFRFAPKNKYIKHNDEYPVSALGSSDAAYLADSKYMSFLP